MREWGHKGITAARWENVVDYGFIAAYVIFLLVAVEGARRRAVETGRPGLVRAGALIVVLPLVAGVADAIQNAALLVLLGRHAQGVAPQISFASGVVTGSLALISLVYLGVVRLARRPLPA